METTPAISSQSVKCCRSIEYYRKLIQMYIERSDFNSALFWADKVVSLSNGSQQDVFLLARTMSLCGQYQRAVTLLKTYKFERTNLHFRCLTAHCLFMSKEYTKALDALDLENNTLLPGHKIKESKWQPSDDTILGNLFLLRGKIYEALMNRTMASESYKEALHHDVYCYEAFELLTQHQMLSRREEICLFDSLPFSKMCGNADQDFIKFLYSSKIKKYTNPSEPIVSTQFVPLQRNLDLLASDAERAYYNCDFQKSFQIASQVIAEDPYHSGCMPVYIASLIELNKTAELFKVSHRLVEVMVNSALAWYAVGSYYFLIGKHESCRRNLNKALSLDPVFGPAWLLFGHSFATESEHDQAMAAYFKATQLMRGCHLPLLHVGLECGVSNNPQLAMKFLLEARLIAPIDPFVHHEMGVLRFQEKKYAEALTLFADTLDMVEKPQYKMFLKKWEPLYNNLGHCYRKLKKFKESYTFHRKALVLSPANATTYAAIGLLQAVSGEMENAAESFHKALSLRRDDAFSNTMLRHVMEKLVEDSAGAEVDEASSVEDKTETE